MRACHPEPPESLSAYDTGRSFWDENARRYDDRFDERGADGYALRARLAVTLAFVGNGPGTALDAGMGPGRLCVELARRGFAVSGVDASARMVELARQRLSGTEARLCHASIEELPFDESSFDVVVATGVLEFAHTARALCALARVLRPGGLAIVSYPNGRSLYGRWKGRCWYPLSRSAKAAVTRRRERSPAGTGPLTEAQFQVLLDRAGLELERVAHASYLLVPTPIDTLLPRFAEYVGRRLETSSRGRHLLATQVVYAARKPPESPCG